jgi:subtilisin-like proprotein convertase family protein
VAEICFDGSVAIPDNNTTGVDNTLNGFAGALLNLDVYVKINHTWVGDVVVTLRHDAGAPVTLIDRPGVPTSTFGCSGANVDVTLSDAGTAPVESTCGTTPPVVSGVLIPNATLSAFDGQDFAGAWVLNVSDRVGGDTGNLVRWCLLPSQAQASPDLIFEDGFE